MREKPEGRDRSLSPSELQLWGFGPHPPTFPPPGDLPNLGIEPMSLMSPALAGEFFTTNTTWEAPFQKVRITNIIPSLPYLLSVSFFFPFSVSMFLWACLCWWGVCPMFECHPLHLLCPCLSFLVVCLSVSLIFSWLPSSHLPTLNFPYIIFFSSSIVLYTHTHTHTYLICLIEVKCTHIKFTHFL